ncbi:hypothetical protein QL285_064026 [Trifolium repens]|nr:hypothetical protein QL285_064026 [Trifolium repens]
MRRDRMLIVLIRDCTVLAFVESLIGLPWKVKMGGKSSTDFIESLQMCANSSLALFHECKIFVLILNV